MYIVVYSIPYIFVFACIANINQTKTVPKPVAWICIESEIDNRIIDYWSGISGISISLELEFQVKYKYLPYTIVTQVDIAVPKYLYHNIWNLISRYKKSS